MATEAQNYGVQSFHNYDWYQVMGRLRKVRFLDQCSYVTNKY